MTQVRFVGGGRSFGALDDGDGAIQHRRQDGDPSGVHYEIFGETGIEGITGRTEDQGSSGTRGAEQLGLHREGFMVFADGKIIESDKVDHDNLSRSLPVPLRCRSWVPCHR